MFDLTYYLTWGSNSPVKYQFSTSISGPWHSTMAANDKYRRDSLDGGKTWGVPYQFVAEDGKPGHDGSDANVTFNNIRNALQRAASTQTSFITVDEAGFPKIYGGKIYGGEIYAGGIGDEGGKIVEMTEGGIRLYDGHGRAFLTLTGESSTNSRVVDYASIRTSLNGIKLSSPWVTIDGADEILFKGAIADFSGVDEVRGLNVTAVFA